MSSEFRKTGISIVGDLPWGAHFCHFYETKQDLLDTLVPYFKTGLESNECCLWVVSDADLITIEEATRALAQVVPDLDRQLSDGNIEILSGHQWYLEKNALNLERVRSAWDAKLKQALARGYEGLRVSGDTFWLADKDWKDFCAYEKQINDYSAGRRMTILCTYPLAKSGAAEVLDVMNVHQFATARRQGEWQVIQSPESIQAKAEVKRLNEYLQRNARKTPEPPFILRYGVAVLAVILALIINRLLDIHLAGAPAMLFLSALMFSAWYGGAKPSLLAMPLAVVAFAYYFVTPVNSLSVDVREIPRLLLFVMASLFFISLSAAQKRAAESRRHARDVLAGTVEELKRTNQALRTENTERKLAEQALRKSENLWRTIFNDAAIGIAIVNPEGRPVETNPTIQKILGYTREELRHLWFVDFTHPDDTIKEFPLHQEMIEGKLDHYQMEKRYIRKDGQVRWVNLIASVIPAEQPGEFFGVGMVEDITERKGAEEVLRRSEDHLRHVIETIPVMTWSVRPDGVVDFLTKRWMDYAGISLEQYVKDPTGPIHPDDITIGIEKWRAAMGEGQLYEEEMRLRRADGEYRWFLVRTAPLRDESGNIVKWYGVSTDIDDLKRAEEQLKATSAQLRALSASRQSAREEESTRIAREIHDELGAALTSLRWDLEAIEDGISEATDATQLAALRKKIETMITLTETTLDTVKRLASELRPTALDELGLVDAIEWQATQFETRTGIEVEFDCSFEEVNLNGEQSTAVFRILQEAMTNILRHAQATKVIITMTQGASELLLTIKDNGKGITENGKSGARSLGLLGMRERAHLIGAQIDISGLGREGTLVALRIPIGVSQ